MKATDAVITSLANSGIEVVEATDAMAEAVLSNAGLRMENGVPGVELSAKQKRALETALPEDESSFKGTVVSNADGAKVLNNLDDLQKEYEKKTSNRQKTFIGDLSRALTLRNNGNQSNYGTFETKNGNIVTIRISDHNASSKNMADAGQLNGISIVISRKPNEGIKNDGDAHIVEFYYSNKKLEKSEDKPLVEIIRSIKQALYSGEFTDTTGLAERQEVNLNEIEAHIVYHGSGATFDAFDHSHMGEGEGAQAYGWGTYVTEVEGIGRTYAEAMADKAISEKHKENRIINKLAKEALESSNGNKEEALESLRGLLNESWSDKKRVKGQIKVIETGKNLPEGNASKQLYTVEIPDDNGSNYIYYQNANTKETIDKLNAAYRTMLLERGVNPEDISPYFEPFNRGVSGKAIY